LYDKGIHMIFLWRRYRQLFFGYLIMSFLLSIVLILSICFPKSKWFDWCLIPSGELQPTVKYCRGRKYWSSPYRKIVHIKTYDYYHDQNTQPSEEELTDVYANGNCLVSSWNVSHILAYMVLGYFLPDFFLETLIIGIVFESIESVNNCHDVLDVFYNSIGYLMGMALHKYLN